MPPYEARPFNDAVIKPRRTYFTFPASIPKLWLEASSVKTHFFNAINLFVPAFEDFMVRVLRKELALVRDPALREQIRGFMGQEATHSKVHDAYNKRLRAQGYAFDAYLRAAELVFGELLEKRLGAKVSLSAIAGFEHLTALLAEIMLQHDMLASADPTMKALWEWHAAEETEHKTLAFDYLNAIDKGYPLRVAGALLGSGVVVGFVFAGMILLAAQDEGFASKKTLTDADELFFTKNRLLPRAWSIFREYFARDFHPSRRPSRDWAERVLAQERDDERRDQPTSPASELGS